MNSYTITLRTWNTISDSFYEAHYVGGEVVATRWVRFSDVHNNSCTVSEGERVEFIVTDNSRGRASGR